MFGLLCHQRSCRCYIDQMENLEPTREEINAFKGVTLLEFGAEWCGYCQAAQATIYAELSHFPHIRHIKIEDGKGRRLGRSFHVKLWPTLVFMKEGIEVARLVRDISPSALKAALYSLSN